MVPVLWVAGNVFAAIDFVGRVIRAYEDAKGAKLAEADTLAISNIRGTVTDILGNLKSSGQSDEHQEASLKDALQLLAEVQAQSSYLSHLPSDFGSNINQFEHQRNKDVENSIRLKEELTVIDHSQRELEGTVRELIKRLQDQGQKTASVAKDECDNFQLKTEEGIGRQEKMDTHRAGLMNKGKLRNTVGGVADGARDVPIRQESRNVNCVGQLTEVLGPIAGRVGGEIGRFFKGKASECDPPSLPPPSLMSPTRQERLIAGPGPNAIRDAIHGPAPRMDTRKKSPPIPAKKAILSIAGRNSSSERHRELTARHQPSIVGSPAIESMTPQSTVPAISPRNSTSLASDRAHHALTLSSMDTVPVPPLPRGIGWLPVDLGCMDVWGRKPTAARRITMAEQQNADNFTALPVKARVRMLDAGKLVRMPHNQVADSE